MFMKALLYPLLAQVALTLLVLFRLGALRAAEHKRRRVHPNSVKTRAEYRQVMTDSASTSDNLANLFETPVLFYVAVVLAVSLLVQDPLLVALAWLYVGLRAVHSYIHCTYNDVYHRFFVFLGSVFILLAIWVRLGWMIIAH
jgi:hypothetical protein